MPLKPIQTQGPTTGGPGQAATDQTGAAAQQRVGQPITVRAPDVINRAAKYTLDPSAVLSREGIITERWRVFWQGLARVSPYARNMAPEAHFPAPQIGELITAVGMRKGLA